MSVDSQPFYPLRNAEANLREDQRSFLESAEVSRGLPSLFYGTLRDPFPAPDQAGPEVECIIVHNLNPFEQTMVAWYEWDEYQLWTIRLTDGRKATRNAT